MFEVLDLSSRALPQLKDICKQFGIDAKGLAKPDMVLKIIDAQAANKELAAKYNMSESYIRAIINRHKKRLWFY
mgnify:CR=1 FL=1